MADEAKLDMSLDDITNQRRRKGPSARVKARWVWCLRPCKAGCHDVHVLSSVATTVATRRIPTHPSGRLVRVPCLGQLTAFR